MERRLVLGLLAALTAACGGTDKRPAEPTAPPPERPPGHGGVEVGYPLALPLTPPKKETTGGSPPGDRPETTPPGSLPRDPSVERVRAGHAAVRRANRSEVWEDYLEAIDGLITEFGEARVGVLARRFGVTDVAATLVVDRLRQAGYVDSPKHAPVTLTDAGRAIASHSRARHAGVLRFLLAIGVPRRIAASDAEGMEHHVGEETLAVFERFAATHAEALRAAEEQGAAEELVLPSDPARFERVRAAHATELTEDYVEAIDDFVRAGRKARIGKLAEVFGVSHVTSSRIVGRLRDLGLVASPPRRPVELTEEGRRMAESSRARHAVVLRLFLDIGVPQEAAEIDAEGVEHHVSDETLRIFGAFSRRAEERGSAPK